MAHGELYLSIGELSPALDDSLLTALRNATDNVTDFKTRRLQRQRECLPCEVLLFDLATVALEARQVSEISRPFLENHCPLFERARTSGGWGTFTKVARLTSLCLSIFIYLSLDVPPLTTMNGNYQNIASSRIRNSVFARARRNLFSVGNTASRFLARYTARRNLLPPREPKAIP
jgi:hypothetical protein